MKTALLATAILAIAASLPAGAHDLSISDVNDLPVSQVATFHSMAGEGLSAFVKRIAPEFSGYTERTGHEACAVIGVTKAENDGTVDGAFSVTMSTIHSQIACTSSAVEEGYTSLGRTIHSHPQKHVIRLTALDMKARGTPAGKLRTETPETCKFSDQDYAAPGYLVTCGKVLVQTGRGTEKEL